MGRDSKKKNEKFIYIFILKCNVCICFANWIEIAGDDLLLFSCISLFFYLLKE